MLCFLKYIWVGEHHRNSRITITKIIQLSKHGLCFSKWYLTCQNLAGNPKFLENCPGSGWSKLWKFYDQFESFDRNLTHTGCSARWTFTNPPICEMSHCTFKQNSLSWTKHLFAPNRSLLYTIKDPEPLLKFHLFSSMQHSHQNATTWTMQLRATQNNHHHAT